MRKHLIIILLAVLLFHPGNIGAQTAYNGNLSLYEKQVEKAISQYYLLAIECIMDPGTQDRMINSIKQTYLMSSGVYIPDCMEYDSKAHQLNYENYILELARAYQSRIKSHTDISTSQKNLKILGAEWIEDGKGLMLNVTYDNELEIGGKILYKGKSQALVCYPDITNMLDYRFRQITPSGWSSGKKGKKLTFEQAMESYLKHDFNQSFKQFLRLTEEGNPDAWGYVGYHYLRGWGVKADTLEADQYFRRTFSYDTPYSHFFQAINYLEGRGGVEPDTMRAFRLAEKSAAAGNPNGTNLLGEFYYDSMGVARDYQKARTLFEKAMKMNFPQAYMQMGYRYLLGDGVPADVYKGFELIKKSIDLGATSYGLMSLLYTKGIGCEKNIDRAMEYAQKGVELNDKSAYARLGACYMVKRKENPEYEKEAIRYLEMADKEGDYSNNYILAAYYYYKNPLEYWWKALDYMESFLEKNDGDGDDHYLASLIYQNHTLKRELAFKHIRIAYEKGNPEAIDKIGDYYYFGDGMEKPDAGKAYMYYKEAVEKGLGKVSYHGLGLCLYNGAGVAKDTRKALQYFEEGAGKGYPLCCNRLGKSYYNGTDGYSKDLKKAEELFTTGSSKPDMEGAVDCMAALGLMHAKNETTHPDLKETHRLWALSDELQGIDAPYFIGLSHEWGKYGYEKDRNKALFYFRKAADRGNKNAESAYKELRGGKGIRQTQKKSTPVRETTRKR